MKKILKKNQVILSVVALMFIAAGYMNYTADANQKEGGDSTQLADLGDAKLVSSEAVENIEQGENTANEENIVDTSTKAENSYFTESKLEREKMYSQMLESYQKLLESEQISSTQKEISQNEVNKINETKNAIMISENLIKNKGFSDVVIFVNGNSVNIVVKATNLTTEQIAQIQNIIMRELEENAENIHITCKEWSIYKRCFNICMLFVAAPFLILSATTHKFRPECTLSSRLILPT